MSLSETLSVERAARASAALFLLSGGAVAITTPLWGPLPEGGSELGVLLVALTALLSGLLIWFLPWARWPRFVTLPLVPLALLLVVLLNAFARIPHLYAIFFLVVYVWIGLFHARGTSLWSAPLLALSYLAPVWLTDGSIATALRSLAVLLPVCVALGETVAWVASRLREAESARARSEAKYASLVRHAAEAVSIAGTDGVLHYVSPAVERLLGVSPVLLVGRHLVECVHPEDAAAVSEWFRAACAGDRRQRTLLYRMRHATGMWRWLEGTVTNLLDDPAVGGMLVNGRDVTARIEAENALRASEARFRSLLENSSDMVSLLGPDGTILFHYPPGVLGYSEGESLGKNFGEFLHPDDRAPTRERFLQALKSPGALLPIACRIRDAAGGWRWFECIGRNCLADPEIRGVVINSRDVTDRREAESRLQFMALHDGITGLPNRELLLQRMEAALHGPGGGSPRAAILFFDLDEFKLINDSHGHAEGDRVLQAVAERLRRIVQEPDLLARFGGDEFAVLCPGVRSRNEPLALAAAIEGALGQPLEVGARVYHLSVSIGISFADPDHLCPEDLLRDADVAMYAAKASTRSRLRVFDEELRWAVVRRLELEQSLRRALEQGELAVHYQPEVDLATRGIRGAEALLRWRHHSHGLLEAADFVPAAEETRLIVPIGDWLLRQACFEAAQWTCRGGGDLRVSINLSARELMEDDLPRRVDDSLRASELAPHRLCLEITERSLINDERQAARTLGALKEIGLTVALDDFGTGYSSLTYLRRFPVDRLKIDRSFVRGLGRDHGDDTIVRAVIELAERLGMEAVAEGVETREQHEALERLGCNLAQGVFYGAAVDRDRFRRMLAAPESRLEPTLGAVRLRPVASGER